jgi:hypothetical protein
MNYRIQNEQGLEFYYSSEVYQGYEVFLTACDNWIDDWRTYTVYDQKEQIVDRVINPHALEWVSKH